MTPWWTDQTAGWIGAIAGTANGLLGGLIGTLAGVFAPRGKLRRLVLALVLFCLIAGVASLSAGLFALAVHQPYAVWYPLILIGAMDTLLFGVVTPVIRRAYRQAEARRLDAEELRRT
jgi:MFS family permease